MGLFDLFARDAACPRCGERRARRGFFGRVKCPNRACENFDPILMYERDEAQRTEERTAAVRGAGARRQHDGSAPAGRRPRPLSGDFVASPYAIEVHYRNFRGEEKTFVGDRRTLRRRGRHVTLRVEPTGSRIALATARIHNIAAVEGLLQRCPTPAERRVLDYHLKRGTTSPRYEELCRKYPDWLPSS
jgi:hypothetical protein